MKDEQYYSIQGLVPATHSLSGKAYWHELRLPDGCSRTENLEYAKACCEIARKHQKVRLVVVRTTVISGESNTPPINDGIQVDWENVQHLVHNKANKRDRTGLSYGEKKIGLHLPLTNTALQWLEGIADRTKVNRGDVLELWARGLMSFPTNNQS